MSNIETKDQQIERLTASLAMAEDAAEKGRLARETAGGMEMEIARLKRACEKEFADVQKLSDENARLTSLVGKPEQIDFVGTQMSTSPTPFQHEQLDFTRTRDFMHEAYDFNESADSVASKRNLDVVYPKPNQLQIDVDSQPQMEEVSRRIKEMFDNEDITINAQPSPSGKPGRYHVTITLGEDIGEWERIAMQSVLGSDPMREFLNCMRLRGGTEKPTRFFERKQVSPRCGKKVDGDVDVCCKELGHSGPCEAPLF